MANQTYQDGSHHRTNLRKTGVMEQWNRSVAIGVLCSALHLIVLIGFDRDRNVLF